MKTKKVIFIGCLVICCVTLPSRTLSMPGVDAEEGGDDKPAQAGAAPQQAQAPQPENASATKATPLAWPDTTMISEDNKNLLPSDNKEIVQLFTQAQEVCKNMNDTLTALNTQRDESNKQYRDAINDLDPLLQRIGAAQAAHKK